MKGKSAIITKRKQKIDIMNCKNYRGIRLTDKNQPKCIRKNNRQEVERKADMRRSQCGFRKRMETSYTIFYSTKTCGKTY